MPIPTVAHSLSRGVLIDVAHRGARRGLKGAARLVNEATQAICEAIFFL
jgi:hypothetical protein